jgi:hypothetical protein
MKFVALCILLIGIGDVAKGSHIPPRVESFLQKLHIYYDKHQANWSMPNSKPHNSEKMPSLDFLGAMMLDEETGLAFSPSTGNLYHPKSDVGLEASTGTVVDFKTGKRYSLNDLLEKRKNRKWL